MKLFVITLKSSVNLLQIFISTSAFVYNFNLIIYACIFYLESNKDHASPKTWFHTKETKKLNCPATIILRDIVFFTDFKVKIIWVLALHHMLLCVNLLLIWVTPRKNCWKGIFACFKPQVLCYARLLTTSNDTGI